MDVIALPPPTTRRQVLIRLHDPLNAQARELAGRRGQPLSRVLADLLAIVVPGALESERSRGVAAIEGREVFTSEGA